MRVVVQRVSEARLYIQGRIYSEIQDGLCVLFGVEKDGKEEDVEWLANKLVNLRVFSDDQDKMNLSLKDIDGEILLVSQFTLHASTRKGNRPSFIAAEYPDRAEFIYRKMIHSLEQKLGKKISTGEFGADMKISLVNDGPVTIIIDTELKW